MCVLETFRWLVFAYSTVKSNAIPVFYNSLECFQIITGYYGTRKRIPNFWSKRYYALITKANLNGFRNVKINWLYWLQTILLVTLNLNMSFINDGFIEFILLQISIQRLLNLLAFIVTLPDFTKSVSYGDS